MSSFDAADRARRLDLLPDARAPARASETRIRGRRLIKRRRARVNIFTGTGEIKGEGERVAARPFVVR